jgi:hypothetical protein
MLCSSTSRRVVEYLKLKTYLLLIHVIKEEEQEKNINIYLTGLVWLRIGTGGELL